MDPGTSLLLGATFALVAAFGGFLAVRRSLRARADARAHAEAVAQQRGVPRSLHPQIDPDVCIGSLACLKACPEGDILGVLEHAAALVHADRCVGHGRCRDACPVGAIELVFGTAKRGVDLPDVDAFFESSRPGVHVIGELGGMGLLRNAMRQGIECVEHLAELLRAAPAAPGVHDLAIVGAGPAGLAAAIAARSAGLSYRLLEQDSLGGAVAHYPRQKIVMTEVVDLPLHGRFGRRRMSKEDLLAGFQRVVAAGQLQVEEGVRAVAVEGEDGAFEVVTERHGRVRARKVLLAVGRRGTPRKLGVPGEALPKVTYSLGDAEQHRGRKVLVIGGGDVGVEAALQLAGAGAEVTLSYRGEALGRCRRENRERVEALAAEGRVALLLRSTLRAVTARAATLAVAGAERTIENDHVVVAIGGELPAALLERAGVAMRRYHGEAPGARRDQAGDRERLLRAGLEPERARRRVERRLAAAFLVAGFAVLALLAWKGHAYYPLDARARMASPLHRALRSAGTWGHGVGMAATAFMLSNFLYAARKHLRLAQDLGHIRSWLHFHVFVGFMSPLVIAFHAAFQSRNHLATGTATALAVVVVTGIVGRYVYSLVPAAGERSVEVEELQARFDRLRDEIEPLLAAARDRGRVQALLERVSAPVGKGSLVALLASFPAQALAARVDLLRVRRLFPSRAAYADFRDGYGRLRRLRVQIQFFRSLKRFLGAWRILHASLAVFLVLAIAAHIGVSLYLGYGLLRR